MTNERPIHVATVALVRAGRILLVHRRPDRQNYPDCWDLVGGHVESGETPIEAARRECLEEVGVEVGRLAPLVIEFDDPRLEVHPFLATDWIGEPANLAPEEHDALRWFRADELAALELAAATMLPGLLVAVRE